MAKKKKLFNLRWVKIILFALVLSIVSYFGYQSLLAPTEINLIAEQTKTEDSFGRTVQPDGCYYQQVQCVMAPCEPILVCPPTPSPTASCIPQPTCPAGRMCAAVMLPGYCGGPVATPTPAKSPIPPAGCTSWFDGCNTCKVQDGVIVGCTKLACKMDAPVPPYCLAYDNTIIIPTPKPTPTSCVVNLCPPGADCKLMTLPEGQVYCDQVVASSVPTASASIGNIATFDASVPCSTSSFKSYTFTCKDGRKIGIAFESCMHIADAMTQVQKACGAR